VPEVEPVNVTQEREFAADQVQSLCVVTVIVPLPPAAGNDWSVGLME
jgi:hypothetical protein